ncbi:MAG: NUDIX hydrolase [Gammaproteobacteria bacterium]
MKTLIARRLAGTRPAPPENYRVPGLPGDLPAALERLRPRKLVPAAVLLPIIERPGGFTMLFTVRAPGLRHHAGQVSFPGGRLDALDAGPRAAALRESAEEVGLAPDLVEVVGYLPNYLTITGYSVTPVVGFVDARFQPAPDAKEVAEAFEVPLEILLAPANMQLRYKRFLGVRLPYYEMPWGGHRIWGATAAMLVNFRDMLREEST